MADKGHWGNFDRDIIHLCVCENNICTVYIPMLVYST